MFLENNKDDKGVFMLENNFKKTHLISAALYLQSTLAKEKLKDSTPIFS